jgi:hypothetical protein
MNHGVQWNRTHNDIGLCLVNAGAVHDDGAVE